MTNYVSIAIPASAGACARVWLDDVGVHISRPQVGLAISPNPPGGGSGRPRPRGAPPTAPRIVSSPSTTSRPRCTALRARPAAARARRREYSPSSADEAAQRDQHVEARIRLRLPTARAPRAVGATPEQVLRCAAGTRRREQSGTQRTSDEPRSVRRLRRSCARRVVPAASLRERLGNSSASDCASVRAKPSAAPRRVRWSRDRVPDCWTVVLDHAGTSWPRGEARRSRREPKSMSTRSDCAG